MLGGGDIWNWKFTPLCNSPKKAFQGLKVGQRTKLLHLEQLWLGSKYLFMSKKTAHLRVNMPIGKNKSENEAFQMQHLFSDEMTGKH